MILRQIEDNLTTRLGSDKVIIILGARQIGKTTLLKKISTQNNKTVWLNADEALVQ